MEVSPSSQIFAPSEYPVGQNDKQMFYIPKKPLAHPMHPPKVGL